MPETENPETNVYDMRLVQHEDGWIYGLFCTERVIQKRLKAISLQPLPNVALREQKTCKMGKAARSENTFAPATKCGLAS